MLAPVLVLVKDFIPSKNRTLFIFIQEKNPFQPLRNFQRDLSKSHQLSLIEMTRFVQSFKTFKILGKMGERKKPDPVGKSILKDSL